MSSVEDALARWHRMQGHETLWVPGTDHAGIATQAVVEKKLIREGRPSRLEMSREAFVEEVWKWKNESGNAICGQLKRMGISADWDRESFTLDEPRSLAVTEAFVRMYETGKIYRATRLVNWCCALRTAISDIEVDFGNFNGRKRIDIPGYERPVLVGIIDHFNYPVAGSETGESITVATTRLETMLGDTAVAIHPDDERYKHLHGKFVKHPFDGRELPIVLDAQLVKMDVGTGCVKITPAHDHNDYECGKRHALPFINILNPDGTLNAHCGKFAGMKRFEARDAVRKELEALGLFVEQKDHELAIGLCSRTGDIIEPYLVPQWYVDVSEMAAQALEAEKTGQLTILPEFERPSWHRWLSNPVPWCVSRQLWWGHRIPAFLIWKKGEPRPDPSASEGWFVGRNAEEALSKARASLGVDAHQELECEQDPDVLDTWFSSGLLPFSNLGWPNTEHPDFKRFFPTTLLETGSDILFFWVARMVMMSLALTGQLPFREVFLHPMVRDAQGRKMSKQLGNVVDPIDIVEGITLADLQEGLKKGNLDPRELKVAMAGQQKDYPKGISECGTDALRFTFCLETGHSRSVNLSVDKVVSIRNWCNKLWNALRFASSMFPAGWQPAPTPLAPVGSYSFVDRWIASRLNGCIQAVQQGFSDYMLSSACDALYKFLYNDLCDVYLEAIKPVFWNAAADGADPSSNPGVLAACETLYTCIETGLRLLHPFMPFLTEELWQRLPRRAGDAAIPSIMVAPWPGALATASDATTEANMAIILDICHALRSLRSQYGITSQRPALTIRPLTPEVVPLITELASTIDRLASVSATTVLPEGTAPPAGCGVAVIGHFCELHLSLKGMVDFPKELKRLQTAREKSAAALTSIIKRLENPQYLAKAKPELIEKDQELKAQAEAEVKSIDDAIVSMKALAEQNQDSN